MNRNAEEVLIFEALSQVKTPSWDIRGAVSQALTEKAPARPLRRFPRTALLAAALLAVLVIGAAAMSISGLWQYFFTNPIPQSAVTTVGVSQTAGDYTLTLEDAMVDDNGVILLLALSRADGGPIDPNASLQTHTMSTALLVDGGRFRGGGGFDGRFLSEDGKTLYFSYEIVNSRSAEGEGLIGRALTLTAEGVAVQAGDQDGWYYYTPKETVDLFPLASSKNPDLSAMEHWEHEPETREIVAAAVEGQHFSFPLPLTEEFPQYTVRGAVTLEDGLAIAITQELVRVGSRICAAVDAQALIDTRDGTRYDLPQGQGLKLADGTYVSLFTFLDCPLTAADLPYLRLEVGYCIDRVLSEEPFSLTFSADSSTAMILALDKEISLSGTDLHPSELRLSALGVTLRFSDSMDTVSDAVFPSKTAPVVTLKDGTVVSTVWRGGYGGLKDCNLAFQATSADGERIFLDTAQIRSVSLDGETLWNAP